MFLNSKRGKNTQNRLPNHEWIQDARCLAGIEVTEWNFSIWGPAAIRQVAEIDMTKEAEVLFVLFSSPLDRVEHCFLAVM